MTTNKLLTFGICGTIVAAICCFTPILVIVLGAFGLSAWVSGLDTILLPTLLAFILITVYALWKELSLDLGDNLKDQAAAVLA